MMKNDSWRDRVLSILKSCGDQGILVSDLQNEVRQSRNAICNFLRIRSQRVSDVVYCPRRNGGAWARWRSPPKNSIEKLDFSVRSGNDVVLNRKDAQELLNIIAVSRYY